MDTIILLPGGGGSILTLNGDPQGDQIWPPTLLEFATQYGRLPQLLNPLLGAVGIIDSIPPNQLLAWPVYRPLLGDLFAISNALQKSTSSSSPMIFERASSIPLRLCRRQ